MKAMRSLLLEHALLLVACLSLCCSSVLGITTPDGFTLAMMGDVPENSGRAFQFSTSLDPAGEEVISTYETTLNSCAVLCRITLACDGFVALDIVEQADTYSCQLLSSLGTAQQTSLPTYSFALADVDAPPTPATTTTTTTSTTSTSTTTTTTTTSTTTTTTSTSTTTTTTSTSTTTTTTTSTSTTTTTSTSTTTTTTTTTTTKTTSAETTTTEPTTTTTIATTTTATTTIAPTDSSSTVPTTTTTTTTTSQSNTQSVSNTGASTSMTAPKTSSALSSTNTDLDTTITTTTTTTASTTASSQKETASPTITTPSPTTTTVPQTTTTPSSVRVLYARQDATIFEAGGASGSSTLAAVGSNGAGNETRYLIAFDLSAIPAGVTIIDAILEVSISSLSSHNPTTVSLFPLNAPWSEGPSSSATPNVGVQPQTGDATWLHKRYPTFTWTSPGGDMTMPELAESDTDAAVAGVLAFRGLWNHIQRIVDGELDNYGFIMTAAASTPPVVLHTREEGRVLLWPRLIVEYTSANVVVSPTHDVPSTSATRALFTSSAHVDMSSTSTSTSYGSSPYTSTSTSTTASTPQEDTTTTVMTEVTSQSPSTSPSSSPSSDHSSSTTTDTGTTTTATTDSSTISSSLSTASPSTNSPGCCEAEESLLNPSASWSAQQCGKTYHVPCGQGKEGNITRFCFLAGFWGQEDETECVTIRLRNTVEPILEDLSGVTLAQVATAIAVIEETANAGQLSNKDANYIVNAIAAMMATDRDLTGLPNYTRLLNIIDTLLSQDLTRLHRVFNEPVDAIVIHDALVTINVRVCSGVQTQFSFTGNVLSTYCSQGDSSQDSASATFDWSPLGSSSLPRLSFPWGNVVSEQGQRGLVVATYLSSNVLLEFMIRSGQFAPSTSGLGVLSVDAFNADGQSVSVLSDAMTYVMAEDTDDDDEFMCAWFDIKTSKESNQHIWSTSGCRTKQGDAGVVTCTCSHLTDFSLRSKTSLASQGDGPDNSSLLDVSPVVYLAYAISALLLLLIILSFVVFEAQRHARRRFIAVNLAFTLMCYMIVMCLVFGRVAEDKIGCTALSMLTQYFALASLIWLAINLHQMYTVAFVVSIDLGHRSKTYKALIAYCVPAAVSAAALLTDYLAGLDRLAMDEHGVCSYHHELMWGFHVAPLLLSLAVVVGFLVALRAKSSDTFTPELGRASLAPKLLPTVLILCFLMLALGIPILAIGLGNEVIALLAALASLLPSVFLFGHHVLAAQSLRRRQNVHGEHKKSFDPSMHAHPMPEVKPRLSSAVIDWELDAHDVFAGARMTRGKDAVAAPRHESIRLQRTDSARKPSAAMLSYRTASKDSLGTLSGLSGEGYIRVAPGSKPSSKRQSLFVPESEAYFE